MMRSLLFFSWALHQWITIVEGQSISGTLDDSNDYGKADSTHALLRKLIRDESQCSDAQIGELKTRYKVTLDLRQTTCDTEPDKEGFHCHFTFLFDDEFYRIGHALCVDLEGISESLPTSQLLFTAVDESRGKELKRIYTTTNLQSNQTPVCTGLDSAKVSMNLDVRDSVRTCSAKQDSNDPETIMEKIAGTRVKMGTVSLQQKVPIYIMEKQTCFNNVIADVFPQYIVKIDTQNFSQKNIVCGLRFLHELPEGPIQVCITLVYFSEDLDCHITLALSREGSDSDQRGLSFKTGADLYSKPRQLCYIFQQGSPELTIHKGSMHCVGRFAVFVNFTMVKVDDLNDQSDGSSSQQRHVMMAVFISLVCACLVVLGITCLCCLRMRSKRVRQRARAHRERTANHNEAFSSAPAPPSFPGIAWHDAQPNQVAGLPSYEEVAGTNASDEGDKPEMPPSYESLYTPPEDYDPSESSNTAPASEPAESRQEPSVPRESEST